MIHRLTTDAGSDGQRLDLFLQASLPEFSRGRIRRIIDLGGVHLDGRRVRKCGIVLGPGQKIELHLDGEPLKPFRIDAPDVLFQDDYLIALNKPAGINTQPTPARYKGTLYEALQVWLGRDRRFGRRLEIGMAQRLDHHTSGVIIFSIHPRSHKLLTGQMQDRSARKHYLAVVAGCPEPAAGTYVSALARDRRRNRVVSVAAGGKEAVSRYRVLSTSNNVSLVEVELVTGRMHQIRAHFSEAGHPLLGDTIYGGPPAHLGQRCKRQCLHSWRLELSHPLTNKILSLVAPVPADMQLEHFPFDMPDRLLGGEPPGR